MLEQKYDYKYEYARGMKLIFDLEYKITNYKYLIVNKSSTLSYAVDSFRGDFYNEHAYCAEFLKNLEEDLIQPVKVFLDEHTTESKKMNQEMKILDKEYKEAVEKLENVSYHNSIISGSKSDT